MTVPDQGATPSFAHDIKPLFREEDREAMEYAFDLWDHEDVAEYADAIRDSVRSGAMPCDERWSDEAVAAFQRWMDAGKPA